MASSYCNPVPQYRCALCGKSARAPTHFVLLGEVCRREGVKLKARASDDFHMRCARVALARLGGPVDAIRAALDIKRSNHFAGDVIAVVPAKVNRRKA